MCHAAPVPAKVAALADGVLKTMFLGKLKIATALLLGFILFAAGGTLTLRAVSAHQIETMTPEPKGCTEQAKGQSPIRKTGLDKQAFRVFSEARAGLKTTSPLPGRLIIYDAGIGVIRTARAPSPEFAPPPARMANSPFRFRRWKLADHATVALLPPLPTTAVNWLAPEQRVATQTT